MNVSADALLQLCQAGTFIVASLGVRVAMINQRRQLNAQMFLELSGRFQELLRLFPTEAWLANRNPARPLPPPSTEITECSLYCIQLVADAYRLHRAQYVSKALWSLWEREIRHTLTGPVFRREWTILEVEFTHDEDFRRYISGLMLSSPRLGDGMGPLDTSSAEF